MACKQACYKNIIVPSRFAQHMSRDGEESAYRKCLANSQNFPALKSEDFISCSNDLYYNRIKILSEETYKNAESIFLASRR